VVVLVQAGHEPSLNTYVEKLSRLCWKSRDWELKCPLSGARRTIVTRSLIFFTTRKGHVHHVGHISNVVEQFTYLQTIGLN
jgi:hypothetical protein